MERTSLKDGDCVRKLGKAVRAACSHQELTLMIGHVFDIRKFYIYGQLKSWNTITTRQTTDVALPVTLRGLGLAVKCPE